jgi:hypothetical protein
MEWAVGNSWVRPFPNAQYDVEHVLEWQVVTHFFDWISVDHYKGKETFDDPITANAGKKKLTFCNYWNKWLEAPFQLNGMGPSLLAAGHIAAAYPSTTGPYKEEFVYLQHSINSPVKSNVSQ